MRDLKRLSLLTALALAGVAWTAASASADIVNSQGTYVGEFEAVNTGPDPTFTAGNVTITCTSALIGGFDTTPSWIDGNAPASGNLDFRWSGCSVVSGTQSGSCTVQDALDVDVSLTEANAPDWTITNTETFGTLISCGIVFNCTVSSNASTSPVTAEVDSDTQIIHIDDTLEGDCLGSPSVQWTAQYLITVPEDGLSAAGSP